MKEEAQFASNGVRQGAGGPRPYLLQRLLASLKAALAEPEPKGADAKARTRDSVFQPPKY